MRVENFIKPDYSIQSVVLFYHGKYPKKSKPLKDITLPTRLWPDAKYYIKTSINGKLKENTVKYLREAFKGHIIEFVDDLVPADMLYIHHENYNCYGGVVKDCYIDISRAIQSWNGLCTVFYNDELFSGFYDLRDYIEGRTHNETFLIKNPKILERVIRKEDWRNVTLLLNENKICNWADTHIREDLKSSITASYLSDSILYDLPKQVKPKQYYGKRGIYVPLFTSQRVSVCDKIFNSIVDITFAGSGSEKLKDTIKGDGNYINNIELPTFLQNFDWTIYIGKGVQSSYLGATFYEPLLKGLPVFVWLGTDRDRKIFNDLDCYFSTEEELDRLVKKWDMKELFNIQSNKIFLIGN